MMIIWKDITAISKGMMSIFLDMDVKGRGAMRISYFMGVIPWGSKIIPKDIMNLSKVILSMTLGISVKRSDKKIACLWQATLCFFYLKGYAKLRFERIHLVHHHLVHMPTIVIVGRFAIKANSTEFNRYGYFVIALFSISLIGF